MRLRCKRLPCAGGAHQGDLLPRLGRNLMSSEDGLAGTLAEVHVGQRPPPRQGVGDGAAVRADVLPGPLAGAVVGGDHLAGGGVVSASTRVTVPLSSSGTSSSRAKTRWAPGHGHDHKVHLLADLDDGAGWRSCSG